MKSSYIYLYVLEAKVIYVGIGSHNKGYSRALDVESHSYVVANVPRRKHRDIRIFIFASQLDRDVACTIESSLHELLAVVSTNTLNRQSLQKLYEVSRKPRRSLYHLEYTVLRKTTAVELMYMRKAGDTAGIKRLHSQYRRAHFKAWCFDNDEDPNEIPRMSNPVFARFVSCGYRLLTNRDGTTTYFPSSFGKFNRRQSASKRRQIAIKAGIASGNARTVYKTDEAKSKANSIRGMLCRARAKLRVEPTNNEHHLRVLDLEKRLFKLQHEAQMDKLKL